MVHVNWSELRGAVAKRWAGWALLLLVYVSYRELAALHEDLDTIGIALVNALAALRTHT